MRKDKEKNMLNTLKATLTTGARWDAMQQPVHGSAHTADYLRLLAALDEGWQIVEAADMLAHGTNAEGRGYLLTLMHPRRSLTREWNVMRSPEMDALLAYEVVPMAR
jgi:hypothetical protein